MMSLVATILAVWLAARPVPSLPAPSPTPVVLSSRQMSLENRHRAPNVNTVFKKNILLNLAYLDGSVTAKKEIVWDQIVQPKSTAFTLQPNETFAYHDHVLPEYAATLSATTRAHFSADEGFLSDGYLYGDGVCHLASLINWAAQDAGLAVKVTKNHNFATIPDVPREYGVSIYTIKSQPASGVRNNLYITNPFEFPVSFRFDYNEDGQLKVSVIEDDEISSGHRG